MSNPISTVYFRGFPEDIPNDQLETVFAEFGKIVKFFVHKSRTYGMVEYYDISSCSEVISNLNGKYPLNLYLNMAKTQSADKGNSSLIEHKRSTGNKFNNHTIDFHAAYEEDDVFVDENNSLISFLRDPETNEIYVPIRYAQNIRIIKKFAVQADNGLHRNGNLSDDDCSSVSKGICGRKVKFNQSSPHDMKIERNFNDDDTALVAGNRKINKKQHYGNRMSTDGFNLTKKDESKPGFGNRFSIDNSANDGGFNFNKKDDTPKSNFGNRFSADKRSTDGFNKNDIRRIKPGTGSSGSGDEVKSRFNKKINGGASENPTKKIPKKDFTKSKGDGDWGSASVEQSSSISSFPIVKKFPFKPKTNKVLYKTIELPKNKYTQVRVEQTVTETLGWVQMTDKESEFEAFMLTVIEQALITPVPTTPEVGKICLATFESVWFRAVVLTVFPKVTVRFIDYGNESVVEGEILEMSSEARDVPAYAVCINLADGAPCKIKNLLSINVKPVKVDNDVVVVHVENGIYEQELESPVASTSSAILPTVTNSLSSCQEAMMAQLEANMTGMFEATIQLSSTKTVAFFLPLPFADDARFLENISKNVEEAQSSSFRPKVGDLVTAVNDGWNRALILQIENCFKVAFIDFGTIKTVQEVKPLPDDFKNIPQFSCVVTVSNTDLTKINENNDGLSFKITKILNNTVHCSLFTTDEADLCKVTFVLWNPLEETSASKSFGKLSKISSTSASSFETVKQAQLQTRNKLEPAELKLKNGDDVKIIDERKGYLFVRTKEAADILKKVDKYISEYAPKAPKILEKPVVGQYVAAQYDNMWYRAKVINVKQNTADILYIDYGNEELKPFFSLKQLDEASCDEPCTLIKIKLKGFVEKPFTAKCLAFFANLSETNYILKATFQGSEENGVDLTMKDGKSITDELNKMIAIPKPFQSRKELYMKIKVPTPDDPRVLALSLEEIPFGKTEVRYMCDITLKYNSICVSLNKPELLHKIQVELLDQMTKYVNHVAPKQPYRPIREEVVLVEDKEKWYRAICLEPEQDDDDIVVFFVDYGFNLSVSADKIRRIPQEFVSDELKALGIFASICGLPQELNKELIDRLESLLCKNETYQVDVKSKDADGNYAMDFPDILLQLKSEKLI